MMARPVGNGSRPQPGAFRWDVFLILSCLGFLVLQTSIATTLSAALATSLATIAEPFLVFLGQSPLRSGMELRDPQTGYALMVTNACDGLGIAAVYLSAVAARTATLPPVQRIVEALSGVLAIQVFNLARIVVLFLVLPATGHAFGVAHYYVFPLASAILVATILWRQNGDTVAQGRPALIWMAVAIFASFVWFIAAGPVSNAVVVPLANTLVQLVPHSPVDAIGQRDAMTMIDTLLLTSTSPMRALSIPITAADFTLGIPLLLASLVIARRPLSRAAGLMALSLLLSAVALTLAAHTATFEESARAGLKSALSFGAATPYSNPAQFVRAILAALQNTVVHFNLFAVPLLPLLIPAAERSSHNRSTGQGHGTRRR